MCNLGVLWSSSPLKGQVVASCPAQWAQTHVWLCSFLSGGRSTRATTLPTGNLSLKASGSACVGFLKRQKLAGPSCLSLVCQPPPQPPLRCLEQSAHSSDTTHLQRAPWRWGRLSDGELPPPPRSWSPCTGEKLLGMSLPHVEFKPVSEPCGSGKGCLTPTPLEPRLEPGT